MQLGNKGSNFQRPPYGSPGAGTSGGLLTRPPQEGFQGTGQYQVGDQRGFQPPQENPPPQFLGPPITGFPNQQGNWPQTGQPLQWSSYPQIPTSLPFGQPPPNWGQFPGWAGYLQWLAAMRPRPQMPGGVPGPIRG